MYVKGSNAETIIPDEFTRYNRSTRSLRHDNITPIRCAVYCRVSSEKEEQLQALSYQVDYFTNSVFRFHPNWIEQKVYVDEGISGLQVSSRKAFLEMYEDAKLDKFDVAIVRCVSRWGRNAEEVLRYIRLFREQNVEVFFVDDNIWSYDEEKVIQLCISAGTSQEESRKISRRVLAGQRVSREKHQLYGNGNVLGYALVRRMRPESNTYQIIPEEAETVAMVYDMYLEGMGLKAISNKLIEFGRRKKYGSTNWSATEVARILRNKVYCAYLPYNKSYIPDYLTKKRVNIPREKHVYVKADFPEIIPEKKWEQVQAIMAEKTAKSGKHGKMASKDKWAKKLCCQCGNYFRRDKWNVTKDGTITYGYTCYTQLNGIAKRKALQVGLSEEEFCGVQSICQWKLDFMTESIFKRLWKNPRQTVSDLTQTVADNYVVSDGELTKEYERLKRNYERQLARKERLTNTYLDAQIDIDMFNAKKAEIDTNIESLKTDMKLLEESNGHTEQYQDVSVTINAIQELLENYLMYENTGIADELVEQMIVRVTPTEDGTFKWYLNSSCIWSQNFKESEYGLYDKFVIGFEEARLYRKSQKKYLRENQWRDLKVEVYIKTD